MQARRDFLGCALIALLLSVAPAMAVDDANAAQPSTRDFTLDLGGHKFDPLQAQPSLSAGWDRSAGEGKDLHLIQLQGPTKQAQLDRMRTEGIEVVQYIYPYTYIVWSDRSARRSVESESFVRWTGDFAPEFRVQPQFRNLSGKVELSVMMFRGADPKKIISNMIQLGGRNTSRASMDRMFDVARIEIDGDKVQAIANLPGVYSVRMRPQDGGLRGEVTSQVNVNNVDGTNLAFPGYANWLTAVGVDGSGVVIANVDGGINQNHPDLINRMLGCVGDTCGGSATDSHGTHTAGIMAGDGASGVLDVNGFLRGQGVAPGASMVEQVYSPTFTQAGGMAKLVRESSENGAILSGNSWGPSGSPQGYDDDTRQVDIAVRDAQPGLAGNQEFSYILSFMNGNGGNQTQGSPDEGKNMFTIGSTKAQQTSAAQILEIDDLSANSAHGPALDGRIIPHMVAPGCSVDSTDTASGGYGFKCGTSMASPQVTGGAALFIEQWRARPDYVRDPSPAMIKAIFTVTARNLAGNEDADGGVLTNAFEARQGWGRMDLQAVIEAPENGVQYFDQDTLFDNSGESWERVFSPLNAADPVRIMLVWTDAPGHGTGGSTPAWNNDLDLVVTSGGQTYRGNDFGSNGFSVAGGTADFQNNTEGVFLETAPGGLTVRVEATNINSDGVPNIGDATDQDFALVCYNCAAEPGFTLSIDSGEQRVCAPEDVAVDVTVGQILGFTDSVALSVLGAPAGATAQFTAPGVVPPGTSQLQITNTDATTGGSFALTIEGQSGSITRSAALDLVIDLDRPLSSSPLSPAPGAADVALLPMLQWAGVASAESYLVEVATDSQFNSIVYSTTVSESTHVVEAPLVSESLYFWRVTPQNSCGDGTPFIPANFTTLAQPLVLLVDDDDNGPDVQGTYADTLNALGIAFDVWDTGNSDNEPSAAQLAGYRIVIWMTGDEFGGAAGPGAAGEAALASWLDLGGCLLLSSQDYHYDRDLTSFMQTYLGVASVSNDDNHANATGLGTVFGGQGPHVLSYPYTNYSDTVTGDATSAPAFENAPGEIIALTKDGGTYRTSYWAFGLEAIPTPADRQAALQPFANWCADLVQDGDSDGYDDLEDCAPSDPNVWLPSSPARNLVLDAGTSGMSWSAPLDAGGSSVVYDVLRSASSPDFNSATCMETNIGVTSTADASAPAAGEVWFYLIRAENGCAGNLGTDWLGGPRPGVACD